MVKRTYLLLLFILLLQIIIRIPLLNMPLEMDEGGYAYTGSQILSGSIIYKDIFDHKPPLVPYIYMLIIKFFGTSIIAIRVTTLIFSLIATILIFLIVKYLYTEKLALLSALLYSVFSINPYSAGFNSYPENFMVTFMLLSLFLYLKANNQHSEKLLFLSGLFSGIAFFCKQPSLINFGVILLASLIRYNSIKDKIRAISFLLFGFIIVPSIFILYFFINNALADFIFSVFIFNKYYINPTAPLYTVFWLQIVSVILMGNSILWFFSLFEIRNIIKEKNLDKLTVLCWFIGSVFTLFLSGYLFKTYFFPLLSGLAIFASVGITDIVNNSNKIKKIFILIILIILTSQAFFWQKEYFQKHFNANRLNDYIISIIKSDLTKGDKIACKNIPQIMFKSKTEYPGKYFYHPPSSVPLVAKINYFNLFKFELKKTLHIINPKELNRKIMMEELNILKKNKVKFIIELVGQEEIENLLKFFGRIGYKLHCKIDNIEGNRHVLIFKNMRYN